MVTHSREVIGVADRIFTIQRGRLLESPADRRSE
jgi:ABC-type lipoprotein export system ATPase subunit